MISRALAPLAISIVLGPVVSAADLADIVPPGAEAKKIVGDCRFTEGPAWSPQGFLLFSDIPNSRIVRVDVDGSSRDFLQPSGGANGLVFDAAGTLYACQGGDRQVVRIELSAKEDGGPKKIEVLAKDFEGTRFNSPNDLALDHDGGLWFTDPRYRRPEDDDPEVQAVYYIDRAGKTHRVIDELRRPNGILVSNDGKTLYVAHIDERKLLSYPILGPGSLGAPELLFTGDAELDGGGPDGMTLDAKGNIYATYKTVVVLDPKGGLIGRIPVPEKPANCVFGGPGGKTLFITARTSLYALETKAQAAPLVARPTGGRGLGADPDAKPATPQTAATRILKAGSLVLRVPLDWKEETPSSRMRVAQLAVPALGEDSETAEYVVFYFGKGQGGGTAENIDRWIGQFEATARKSRVARGSAAGRTYHLVDVTGTYLKPIGPPIRGQKERVTGQRMLAVVLETEDGSYFLKYTGPLATVTATASEFRGTFGGDESTEQVVAN